MAWSVARTWSDGEGITDTILNAHIRDQFRAQEAYLAAAKGDLFPATGANALSQLGVGNVNELLVADSTLSRGMIWKALLNKGALYGNPNTTLGGASTTYTAPGSARSHTNENSIGVYLTHAMTLKNLRVRISANSGNVTVRKNNVDTSLTAGGAPGDRSDLTHTVSFANGDFLSLALAGIAGTLFIGWSMEADAALST